jgi:hypothetical protein
MADKPDRTRNTVCLPEMRGARIGLCVATQISRYSARFSTLPGWSSPEQAWAQTQGQLAWYRAMEETGELVQLRTASEGESHAGHWRAATAEEMANLPIGYLLSLEGADSILSRRDLHGRIGVVTRYTRHPRSGRPMALDQTSRLGRVAISDRNKPVVQPPNFCRWCLEVRPRQGRHFPERWWGAGQISDDCCCPLFTAHCCWGRKIPLRKRCTSGSHSRGSASAH